jgi:hypothetical protein
MLYPQHDRVSQDYPCLPAKELLAGSVSVARVRPRTSKGITAFAQIQIRRSDPGISQPVEQPRNRSTSATLPWNGRHPHQNVPSKDKRLLQKLLPLEFLNPRIAQVRTTHFHAAFQTNLESHGKQLLTNPTLGKSNPLPEIQEQARWPISRPTTML